MSHGNCRDLDRARKEGDAPVLTSALALRLSSKLSGSISNKALRPFSTFLQARITQYLFEAIRSRAAALPIPVFAPCLLFRSFVGLLFRHEKRVALLVVSRQQQGHEVQELAGKAYRYDAQRSF